MNLSRRNFLKGALVVAIAAHQGITPREALATELLNPERFEKNAGKYGPLIRRLQRRFGRKNVDWQEFDLGHQVGFSVTVWIKGVPVKYAVRIKTAVYFDGDGCYMQLVEWAESSAPMNVYRKRLAV